MSFQILLWQISAELGKECNTPKVDRQASQAPMLLEVYISYDNVALVAPHLLFWVSK